MILCVPDITPPPYLQKKVTVVPSNSLYIKHLISKMADLSSHVIIKYVTSSPTSKNVSFRKTVSVANPSSTRATADLMNICAMGGGTGILELIS